MPETFVLPEDFAAWVAARNKDTNALWIYKPSNQACGNGIKLLSSHSSGSADKKLAEKTGVIQRYIDKPMLIRGYKYDLRIYVVVTSFDPLKVYVNEEGLVRLATERYERPNAGNLDHRTMHLTNFSVNKHSENYVPNQEGGQATGAESGCEGEVLVEEAEVGEDADEDERVGRSSQARGVGCEDDNMPASKMSLGQLRDYCTETGQDYDLMMKRIKKLIIKTLLAGEAPIVNTWHQGANYSTSGQATTQVGPNQTCFEIFGFDVMFDERLKPWLLEVNNFPSLSSSSPFDKRVKTVLIADVFTLVGFMPFDHDLVDRAVKDDATRRLQGLSQKHVNVVTKTHNINSISSAPLKALGAAEWQLILDTHDEFLRRGHFECIYPTREAVEMYAPFMTPRYSNLVLARWLQEGGERCFSPEGREQIPAWVPRLLDTRCC